MRSARAETERNFRSTTYHFGTSRNYQPTGNQTAGNNRV